MITTDQLALRIHHARDRLDSHQPVPLVMDALVLELAGDLARSEPGFIIGHFADLAGVQTHTASVLAGIHAELAKLNARPRDHFCPRCGYSHPVE